jgi:hypothetical protein
LRTMLAVAVAASADRLAAEAARHGSATEAPRLPARRDRGSILRGAVPPMQRGEYSGGRVQRQSRYPEDPPSAFGSPCS